MTISDEALEELLINSAGNPYFAKLIANQLFSDMVVRRCSDANEFDVRTAIGTCVSSIVGNSFAHFWSDGLFDNADEADQKRIERSSVLLALGLAARKQTTINHETAWNEFRRSCDLALSESEFDAVIREFQGRSILIEDSGNITAKIPLCQSSLNERGVRDSMIHARELKIENARIKDELQVRVIDEEILKLCDN